jgi:hypothetical protein
MSRRSVRFLGRDLNFCYEWGEPIVGYLPSKAHLPTIKRVGDVIG